MISKIFSPRKPVIRQRSEHNISRKNIDRNALQVLYRLADAGYTAYLVGGSVRDLLLGRQPKDFDIGTDAFPNAIKKLFRNCFLVGRRFRLAHIVFGRKVIETSTFRRQPGESPDDDNGNLYQREDNNFGTPEEDAQRRDFTVNGLFYDIRSFAVIDYVGGLKDLQNKTLRSIGDPNIRFREDPVRMMRAVRFSARLGFRIERATLRAIRRHHGEIKKASVPRLHEEFMRLFTFSSSAPALHMLWSYGLLGDLIPELAAFIDHDGGEKSQIWLALQALDNDKIAAEASAGLQIAVLGYQMFKARLAKGATTGSNVNEALQAARETLEPFVRHLRIPKATFYVATSLLEMLPRFEIALRSKPRAQRFARHRLFPQALALKRIVATLDNCDESQSQLQEWEAMAAKIHADVEADELEIDASDDAWRVASGAPSKSPRPRFRGTRHRSAHRRRTLSQHKQAERGGGGTKSRKSPQKSAG